MPVTDRPWTSDPETIARRVDATDVGLLRSLLGGEELEVPEGVVAWVERPDGSGRVARTGDRELGSFVAVLVRESKVTCLMPEVEMHTKEGFPATGRCNLDVAVDCVSAEGLRGFSRTLFVSGPEFSRDDLVLYLAPTVTAAWKALAAESAASDLCAGDVAERFERELRGRLRQICFDAGLELLAVRSASVECPDFDSIRTEQAGAVVEEELERHRRVLRETWLKERKNHALSKNELAEFYEALEHDGVLQTLEREKAKAQAELELTRLKTQVDEERSRGELRRVEDFLETLETAGIRDMFEQYLDLLAGRGAARRKATAGGLDADAADAATHRVLAAAGGAIVAFDPERPDGTGPVQTWQCRQAGLGALRSVRMVAIDGEEFLIGGAQGGCYLVPTTGPAGIRPFAFPDGLLTKGGANSATVAGSHLVATHSEVGVVAWDLSHPETAGERICTHLTEGARTVRGAQTSGDQCVLAVDDTVVAFHASKVGEGAPTVYRGAQAPITALCATQSHIYGATAEGHVWRWAVGRTENPEPVLPRRTQAVTMLRTAVLNGEPVLLVASTVYGVLAVNLNDDTMWQYHAESPIRWVGGAVDLVAGVDRDGHTVVCWEPSRPKARWRRFRSDERMADLWLWTRPSSPEEAAAGGEGPAA